MKLNAHSCGIVDCDTWFEKRPPKKGDKQWKEGRSAFELAKFITDALPSVPREIETALSRLVADDTTFDWDAEYVTALPASREGRNHDAILFNDDIVVTIEAKADETLGNLIEEEISNASVNKLNRISSLLSIIFKNSFNGYHGLRYQLLTAAAGTVLEAEKRGVDSAVMLVLVFKTNGTVSEKNLASNHKDIESFLDATGAHKENDLWIIPNNSRKTLYFKEIVI